MSDHSKNARLKDRAFMFKQSRDFFQKNNVLEVDCPIITEGAPVDAHIDLIAAVYQNTELRYLHSSPEYGMKRLIADGIGDIYQLSHVFRDGEFGYKHNPEFTMAEWYRLNFTLEQMIEDTIEFIRLFLGELPYRIVSYRDAFLEGTGFDYFTATEEDLFNYILENNISYYAGIKDEGKDALLNLILGSQVEPTLGFGELYVLAYYPSTQAALARKRWHGEEPVAERFEVYFEGIELPNGYHELTDASEQRERFHEANQLRVALGKKALPLDEHFLKALERGLPDCCGVAVGFDRLMLLRHKAKSLAEVIAWDWSSA